MWYIQYTIYLNYGLFASGNIHSEWTIQFSLYLCPIYINWKQLTFFVDDESFLNFFPLSSLLIENIRDNQISWVFIHRKYLKNKVLEGKKSLKFWNLREKNSTPKSILNNLRDKCTTFLCCCCYCSNVYPECLFEFSCVQKSTACTFLQQLSKKYDEN